MGNRPCPVVIQQRDRATGPGELEGGGAADHTAADTGIFTAH
jgi:hypothetical protein